MKDKQIKDYRRVGNVISQYYSDKPNLMRKVEQNQDFNDSPMRTANNV